MEKKCAALTEIDLESRVSDRRFCAASEPIFLISRCPFETLSAGSSFPGGFPWLWDASPEGKFGRVRFFREQGPGFFLLPWTWLRPNDPSAIAVLMPDSSGPIHGWLWIRTANPGSIHADSAEDKPLAGRAVLDPWDPVVFLHPSSQVWALIIVSTCFARGLIECWVDKWRMGAVFSDLNGSSQKHPGCWPDPVPLHKFFACRDREIPVVDLSHYIPARPNLRGKSVGDYGGVKRIPHTLPHFGTPWFRSAAPGQSLNGKVEIPERGRCWDSALRGFADPIPYAAHQIFIRSTEGRHICLQIWGSMRVLDLIKKYRTNWESQLLSKY